MKFRKRVIIGAAIVIILSLAGVGVFVFGRFQQHQAARMSFLEKYRAAMENEIRRHFYIFNELPTDANELIHMNSEIRQPWVIDAVIDFGLNRPTLVDGLLAFEREMFSTSVAHASEKIPGWREELKVARERWLQRAPDIGSQLDLFIELDFEWLVGYRFLADLRDRGAVQEKSLVSFAKSSIRAREAKMISPCESDTRVTQALHDFEKAKAVIVEEVKLHGSSG